jgi:hypothetical protein
MNYDPWLCENSKNRKATRIIFRNRLSVLQVVLHRPRDLLRQASSEEGGLEMRLVREHVAGIVEDRVHLNFGMIAKPASISCPRKRPGRSGVLSIIPTTPFLRIVLFHVLESRHVEESTTLAPVDRCSLAKRRECRVDPD